MKVKVITSFKDKKTGVVHRAGEEIELSAERVKEIKDNTTKLIMDKKIKKGTVLVEQIEQQDDSKEAAKTKKGNQSKKTKDKKDDSKEAAKTKKGNQSKKTKDKKDDSKKAEAIK